MEACVENLKDQTMMGLYLKQIEMEFEIVYANFEHVCGGPQNKVVFADIIWHLWSCYTTFSNVG